MKTKYPISTKLHHRKWALSLFSHTTPTRWQIPLQRCWFAAQAQPNNFTKNGLICSTKINSRHNADCSALWDHKAEQSVLSRRSRRQIQTPEPWRRGWNGSRRPQREELRGERGWFVGPLNNLRLLPKLWSGFSTCCCCCCWFLESTQRTVFYLFIYLFSDGIKKKRLHQSGWRNPADRQHGDPETLWFARLPWLHHTSHGSL